MRGLAGRRVGKASCRGVWSSLPGRPGPGCSPSRWIASTLPALQKPHRPHRFCRARKGRAFIYRPSNPVPLWALTPVWLCLDQKGPEKGGAPRERRGSLSLAVRRVLRRSQECPARRVPPPDASGGLRTSLLEKGAHDLANGHGLVAFPELPEASRTLEGTPPAPPAPPLLGNTCLFIFSTLERGLELWRDVCP